SKNCITNGNKTCYEIKYQYEVTSSRATLVGSNQQIVNKGVPINGTYCLIDTVYQKNYLKTFKEFGAKAIRSQQILNDMTTIPKLFTLFKCMDKSCTDVFSDKVMFELHIQLHFSNMENQINNSEQFKHCVYCFKQFDDGESLATHILKNYSFCKYFCPFCFYRAYTPLHVLFHQNLLHNTKNSNIIQLENDNSEEILMAVDYNDFIMPYKCIVGRCTFSCLVSNDFIHHLNKEHQQCNKFCCHICSNQDYNKGLIAYKPSLLIEHFKDHHLNMYQCIFCLFGTETIDSMILHLAMEHFEYDSLCLERSVKSGSCDSSKVGNLNIIRMEAHLYNDLLKIVNLTSGMSSLSENLTERTQKEQSNNAVTNLKKSANIVENEQLSPAIVIQVPASEKKMEMSNSLGLVHHNQINLQKNDSAKLQTVAENKNMISFSPDTIDNIPKMEFFPSLIACSLCQQFITRVRYNLIRHLKAHQRNRDNTTKEIVNPLTSIGKSRHMLEKPTTQSANSFKSMNPKMVERPKVQQQPLGLELNKRNEEEKVIVDRSSMAIKNRSMVKTESAILQTTAENKNMISFSTNTIDNIPMTEFYPSLIGCPLCPKFSTRVRSTLIRHLKAHQRYRDNTTKEIVNSLTSIGKSGHMLEKSKTQSATSSHERYRDNTTKEIVNSLTTIRTSVNMCEKPTTQSARSCESMNPEKVERGVVQQPPIPIELNKQNAKENVIVDGRSVAIKNKSTVKTEPAKLQPVAENKTMISFSPDTIDHIPNTEFFLSLMSCSLCPKFTTRVRYILIRHLKAHKRNQDNTTKEIVNSLNSIGTPMHMFEKPTTQSATSCESMNTEKVERSVVQQHPIALELNKQNAKENVSDAGSSIAIKNKLTVKTESAKLQTAAENKNMISFSPDTINNIPMTEFFPSPIGCPLCPTFSTRVQSTLNRHLKAHQRNRDNTTKEIVNPLTSIGTSVHMFEKTTSQSARSCESMNPEKVERAVVQQPAIALELNKQNAKGNVIVDGSSIAIKNKSTRKT
ncbi:Zinc finger C2H2-type, partial [Cinara cedri]